MIFERTLLKVYPATQLMQSVGLSAAALHVLQCHAALHWLLLAAQCGGPGGGSGGGGGPAPSHDTMSFVGSPVGVRNVFAAYCMEVDDRGSGLSQLPL